MQKSKVKTNDGEYGPSIEIRLNAAVDAVVETRVPDWVQIIPPGKFTGARDYICDQADANSVLAAFTRRRVKPVVDFVHQTLAGEAAPNGAPAAGWPVEMEWRGVDPAAGGIWARIEWTPNGAAAVGRREYRYVSPVLVNDKSTGRVLAVNSIALTNVPAITELSALANAGLDQQTPTEAENAMDLTKLRSILGLPAESSDGDVLARLCQIVVDPSSADPKTIDALKAELNVPAPAEGEKAAPEVKANSVAVALGTQTVALKLFSPIIAANAAAISKLTSERTALTAERDRLSLQVQANSAAVADRETLKVDLAQAQAKLAEQAVAQRRAEANQQVLANAKKISPAFRAKAEKLAFDDPAAFSDLVKDLPELPVNLQIAANAKMVPAHSPAIDASNPAERDAEFNRLVQVEIKANSGLKYVDAMRNVSIAHPELAGR